MINGILAAEEMLAARVSGFVRAYPRQITAAIATVLLCAGGGAFAVATLPNDNQVTVRQVLEAVTPSPIGEQTEALETHDFTLFRSDLTRSSDTAESLLRRLGIDDMAAAKFVRADATARSALLSQPGRVITAEATQDNEFVRLSARWIPDGKESFKRVTIERDGAGFRVDTKAEELTTSSRIGSGVIRSSFFAATDAADIPDAVASQMADIFSGDVDFRALRKGDRFAVSYETFDADGQSLRTGRVLAAEFESNGKVHQAIWFQEPGKKGGYYRPNGDSLQRAYLQSPVEYSRISSGFAMRMHPIAHSWRQHKGIDFAAARGTPVRTVGDGTVEFAGRQSGYGNIVIIEHRNGQSTAYAHLSRIDVKQGQSVSQGQFIGAVGATGWATGPHLHFEFRVNGEYRDPSTIAQQDGGVPIAAASRGDFARVAAASSKDLSAAFSVLQASAN
ncbi:peptidoglycan DD-metalloendopeptidase family protein [Variovorax dokdonensis]|uniref:Peptidoglycan DD-metalloendopeptidase family protein n=1 Tax=Variovorax dokdonensis TaxID=344883 RepID=A0ABT7N4Z9_9BURK|nr:M23 family metallopeptidase [Variovorax dokdonensis]MDM0043016.1 peptidoglycan DD-metalloendopeptidase family protein [Variovorax dokdonensis]